MPVSKEEYFKNSDEVFEASASGRMDVMGGIADYSGSLLLQMPIKEKTFISLSKRNDGVLNIYSLDADKENISPNYCEDWNNIVNWSEEGFNKLRQEVLKNPSGSWAIYIVGCFVLSKKEKNIEFSGANLYVHSEVPFGKGVSSSAALEISVLRAIEKGYNIKFNGNELPILGQKVENYVVGAACGLMDQLASSFGQPQKILPIICQPDQTYPLVSIPKGLQFVGIDSGERHAVSGASYSDVRAAAFMGYSIIALSKGYSIADLTKAREGNNWSTLPYKGYLANISVREFENIFKALLPEKLTGAQFIKEHKTSIDKITHINPTTEYSVRTCTAHPIFENDRIQNFLAIIQQLNKNAINTIDENQIKRLGQWMYESHQSYSSCGLGNERTDEIVQMVKEQGTESGLYGAKITGGGSGGTVCILAYKERGLEAAKALWKRFEKRHSIQTYFFNI